MNASLERQVWSVVLTTTLAIAPLAAGCASAATAANAATAAPVSTAAQPLATSTSSAQPAPKPAPKPASSYVGLWHGALSLGVAKLRIVLHVHVDSTRALRAELDSPDQSSYGIVADTVRRGREGLHLGFRKPEASFSGALSPDGSELRGQWHQGNTALPLLFTRGPLPKLLRPQEPKPPFPYVESEVVYDNPAAPGVRLAGTLTVPRRGGPFAAVLLVTGSGAQDRNEEIDEHHPFRVLADHLARRGIAVLRVDDRGVGKSTGVFAEATTEDFASDAAAGLAFLSKQHEVDPKRIGIIGHSEGGLIAPMLAARSSDVAFIVLMAGPGVRGDSLVLMQAALVGRSAGVPDSTLALLIGINRQLYSVVLGAPPRSIDRDSLETLLRAAGARMAPAPRAIFQNGIAARREAIAALTSPWIRFALAYDPAPALERVRCPVLAIDGERDQQVPAREDLQGIDAALKRGGNSDYRTVELPGLNHLFQTCKTGAVSEYGDIAETIAPLALNTMSAWILAHTKPTPGKP